MPFGPVCVQSGLNQITLQLRLWNDSTLELKTSCYCVANAL